MKKLILLLTTALLFVACGSKKDNNSEAELKQKDAKLAQAEAEVAKLKADLAKAQAKEKEEAAELAALEAQKKLEEAQKAEEEAKKKAEEEAKKESKTEETPATTTTVVADGEYAPQFESEIAALSVGELWSTYKSARAEAKNLKSQGDLENSIKKLLLAAECTVKLNRPDVAAWQFNNAGKQAIDLFAEKTGYSGFKEVHRPLYEQHKALLINAKAYLNKAKEMDDKESDAQRSDLIRRNLNYINTILDQLG